MKRSSASTRKVWQPQWQSAGPAVDPPPRQHVLDSWQKIGVQQVGHEVARQGLEVARFIQIVRLDTLMNLAIKPADQVVGRADPPIGSKQAPPA
jgi:hypothetical protein